MEGQYYGWGTFTEGWRKGPWTPQEDKLLIEHVKLHGEGRWNCVSRLTGLKRSGKSCRLRWVNYLRPDLKRGKITPHEETIILELHARWGNRWSTIARSLPGRTDNEIKNYWRTHFKKGKSTKNIKRARACFLRQQQEQKLQQQKQQQHQEQKEGHPQFLLQNNIAKGVMVPQFDDAAIVQEMLEMEYVCSMPYMLQQERRLTTSFGEEISSCDEECFASWESLWNLDDMGVGMGDQDFTFH